jgi:hypothetical protein
MYVNKWRILYHTTDGEVHKGRKLYPSKSKESASKEVMEEIAYSSYLSITALDWVSVTRRNLESISTVPELVEKN